MYFSPSTSGLLRPYFRVLVSVKFLHCSSINLDVDTDRGGKLCKRCCIFFCEVAHVTICGADDGEQEYKQTFINRFFFFPRFQCTVETAYKISTCPRGNLFHIRIYLITDLKLLRKGVLGLKYFIGDFTI